MAPLQRRSVRPGRVVEVIDERFVCALYPFVDGRTSSHGRFDNDDERRSVVALLVQLHLTQISTVVAPIVGDHRIPRRDSLRAAMSDLDRPWGTGPFAGLARALLRQHHHALAQVLDHYEALAKTVHSRVPTVVSHGEPHRANVIMTADGPVLIDWDTMRLAPAERDLWSLIDEDPTIRALYERQSGITLDDSALALYRLWWDLYEIALFIHDFRRPHSRTADTITAWNGLSIHLDPSRWIPSLGPQRRG